MPVKDWGIEFSSEQVSGLFPFYIAMNFQGKIHHAGLALQRLYPGIFENELIFNDYFNIEHPEIEFKIDNFYKNKNSLFVFRSKDNDGLVLRGQIIIFPEREELLLLVQPWLTDLNVLKKIKLSLNDFPHHSPMQDFLLLLRAQQVSLQDSQELSEKLTQLNKDLEIRVEQRTKKLQQEISERRRLEGELIQSQKLEAVGQLAAGVAHEINNPAGFIKSNLGNLRDYIDDIEKFVNLYKGPVNDSNEACDKEGKILNKSDCDLDFILQDSKELIDESYEGSVRISEIVKDLRTFARPDTGDMDSFDIHECIESAIKLTKSEWKYKCQIIKNFSELPKIKGSSQNICQVIINLVVNAAHATYDKGIIEISTYKSSNNILIKVRDAGEGIDESTMKNIFDPFFTTKAVGVGTGLGLSISHGIIKRHGGNITVASKLGEGSTFTIYLPLPSDSM